MSHLDLVTLIVADYDEAIDFFVGVLGFELADDSPSLTNDGRPKRWVVVKPPNAETGLLLARADGKQQKAAVGSQMAGRVGFFLRVDDFDTTYQRLVDAGIEFVKEPRTEPYGKIAVFKDIAGNPWDLLSPDPRIATPAAIEIDEHGRPEPPQAADETTTILGFLDYQRATLAWKCEGMESPGLDAKVGVSSMTLGGLLKHMAYVEAHWFSRWLHGGDRGEPWESVDWTVDQDWEWNSAADDSPEQLRELWQDSVDRSRQLVADALTRGGLDQLARRTWPDGSAPSLRWILLHMIEEYARHNGHADLLRESVDGSTGE